MSKAFTKEDDAGDAPLVLPRRAPLPTGVPNYVTARGLAQLQAELEAARSSDGIVATSDTERSHQAALRGARIAELVQRLASAELVAAPSPPPGEVRFGATVVFESESGARRRVRIVGVDEADAAAGAIAFVAPLARALLGKRVGDAAALMSPAGEEELTVLEIHYE